MTNKLNQESLLERRLHKVFAEARSLTEHEDELVDKRLRWVLLTSAFLFASYGATRIRLSGIQISTGIQAEIVRIILCLIGIGTSYFASRSVLAAQLAIRAVARKYNNFIVRNQWGIAAEKLQAWKLIGDKETHIPGAYSAIAQPFLLLSFWLVVLVLELHILHVGPEYAFGLSKLGLLYFVALAFAIGIPISLFEHSIREIKATGLRSSELTRAKRKNKRPRSHTYISEVSFCRKLQYFPSKKAVSDEKNV